MFTIAVDVMGGDLGPRVAFKACRKLLAQRNDVQLLLVMTAEYEDHARRVFASCPQVQIHLADNYVQMSDSPASVLRHKPQSSMAVALRLCAEGQAQGVLSTGNSGALMALSRYLLRVQVGIDRPALAASLPTRGKPVLMLDLGANVLSSADQLVQFARLGVAWKQAQGEPSPALALLNIGEESCKGTDSIKQAAAQLQHEMPDYYQGYCEGNDLFAGELDVVVCDGFVGNVALKTSEGLTAWLSDQVYLEFSRNWWTRILFPILRPVFRRLIGKFSASRYAGALLLGVNGVVVKSHGNSDDKTLLMAMQFLLKNLHQSD